MLATNGIGHEGVSRVSIEHGLNTNLVRKWMARVRRRSDASVALVPVRLAESPPLCPGPIGPTIEIRLGEALIAVLASAGTEQIAALVRALR